MTLIAPTAAQPRRAALRAGTALAAALALSGAAPALAQGFNGTIDSSSNIFVVSPNQIQVTAPEAVINWSATAGAPTDTNVDFLPAGQTVTFTDGISAGIGEFTVLNRVIPKFNTAPIAATISFNGTVNSTVNSAQGGSVWFYSPYGIIAGAGSQFNVGSLLLTTSDIQTGPTGSLFVTGNSIGFQSAQAGSFVRVQPGAFINAANAQPGSAYVGIWSPRIEQGGLIRADGSTALIAATSGTLTFNAGLIDLSVSTGTDDANGIVHTGTTGGGASNGDTRTIAMVAVPRNTALTMLLQGSVGYDAAAAAVTDNGAVELYAGSTTQSDYVRPDFTHLLVDTKTPDVAGNIAIGNTIASSRFEALATGAITVAPVYGGVNSPGLVDFAKIANLVAGGSTTLTVEAAEQINVQESLSISSLFRRTGANAAITVTGDPANVLAPGRIDVTQFLSIDARGGPDLSAQIVDPAGAAGQGGNVNISVSRGSIGASQIDIYADGVGSEGLITGGLGKGGDISLAVSSGGSIAAASLFTSASGVGGYGSGLTAGGAATGGNGLGGTITVSDNGGSLRFTDVSAYARGSGGRGADVTGNATGGAVSITIAGQAQTWNSLLADASAKGGGLDPTSTVAGSATGRINGVLLSLSGTGSLTSNAVTLNNNAFISAGSSQPHSASAGGVDVRVQTGASLTVNSVLQANAFATVTPEALIGTLDVAPAMTGGRTSILADGGTITADIISAASSADGVAGLSAGAMAQGGSATVGAINGGAITISGQNLGIFVAADAYGAIGPAPANARGGTARVYADNGTITGASLVAVSASALAGGFNYNGFAGNGFNATGGNASVELLAGGGSISAGDMLVYAKGEASFALDPSPVGDLPSLTGQDIAGIQGNGGIGKGGTAQIRLAAGTLTAGQALVRAYGVGGSSDMNTVGAAWQSGAGQGGNALFDQSGGTAQITTLDLSATGQGGGLIATAISAAAANGGSATGGTAQARLTGGALTLTNPLLLNVTASGGVGMDSGDSSPGGTGGFANSAGALAELLMPLGSTAVLTTPAVSASAAAFGGTGGASSGGTAGTGGSAIAGTARASFADGAFALPSGLSLSAAGFGGGGSVSGNGTGGSAIFLLTDSLAAPATTRTISTLSLIADGNNGTSTAGTTSFTAFAGRAASALSLGSLSATAGGTLAPVGNGFTGALGAVPVTATGAIFVNTPRDIAITSLAGGGITTTGPIILNGRAITMTGPGLLSSSNFTATASGGAISLGAVTTTGATNLTATGALGVTNLNAGGTVTATGASVTIGSTGSLSFGASTASTGAFSANAGGNVTFGNVTANGALTVQAGGLATFNGAAQGSAITVSSGNIAIGGTGRLGTRGITGTITLVNTAPSAGTAIGGAPANSGWSLDAAEALRLFADQSVTIQVPANATNPAEVVIGALGYSYGPALPAAGPTPNIGTGGLFAVSTPGRIRVTGAVAPVVSSATDRLSLTAGTLIDVVTNTGSIVLKNANGALAGILSLTAPTVRVGTTSALAALDGITSLTAASQRLDQNDGVINVAGAIQANALVFTVSGNTLYIQNSGADTQFGNRRGFTANALSINGLAGAFPSFAINGVINAAGGPLTGLDTYAGVLVNGVPALPGGTFNPLSTINGCRVGPVCGLPPGLIAPPLEGLDPLVGLPAPGGSAEAALTLPIVQYGQAPLLDSPPLIDEPVTGIGNDDLWRKPCDGEKDCSK